MAIYSLHHSSIGKSTQAQPHTAGAHVAYITRKRAVSRIDSSRCPNTPGEAADYLRKVEDRLRKNARVADKLMLALPRELTVPQRLAMVRSFAEAITDGRASWFAAFHDKGKDAQNPHCHLMICDRDLATGKRVFGTSEKGSTERLRRLWEQHANEALARANRSERIDRRTLREQGIERRPTVHVGVRARELIRQNRVIHSRNRLVRNNCQARSRQRTVAYPAIDQGKLRLAHNIQIRRGNMLQSRSRGEEATYWQAIDEDAFLRDIRELKRAHAVQEFGELGRQERGSRTEEPRRDIER